MENQDNINEASPIEKRNQDLLDRFAAAALTGYIAASAGDTDYPEVEDAAKDAYDYAEAMMAERLKRDEVGLPK